MEQPRHRRCARTHCALTLVLGIVFAAASAAAADTPAAGSQPLLHDGDRVVFLGDTFIEREADRGFIEAALVAANPESTLTIRNLGWSGDTVWAESRGVFDSPDKGYGRMLALVKELAPTVVFVAYGRNESFRGEAGLSGFRGQLAKLCDDLRAATAATTRLVLITPYRFETAEADRRNADLAAYAAAVRDVAREKQATVVDLFADLPSGSLTENGTHLSDSGYAQAAAVIAATAGRPLPADFVARSADLRQRVIEKNRLFFHRWRPANETYIFLFRAHEQGNNAAEIKQFDPLVEQAEAQVRVAAKELH